MFAHKPGLYKSAHFVTLKGPVGSPTIIVRSADRSIAIITPNSDRLREAQYAFQSVVRKGSAREVQDLSEQHS